MSQARSRTSDVRSSIDNGNGSILWLGSGRVRIALDGDIRVSGCVGIVHHADGRASSPLDTEGVEVRTDSLKDRCGIADRLIITGSVEGLRVEQIWSLYQDQPVVAVEMTVINTGPNDATLRRLVYLDGLQQNDGFEDAFPRWPQCRFLNQPFHWEEAEAAAAIPADRRVTAYWSTVIGLPRMKSLAIGIGETASSQAAISFQASAGRVGLELSAQLQTRRMYDPQRPPLRLRAGASFAPQRMIFAVGANPNAALERYTSWVCRFLDWRLRFPPYTGLFAAYGNDPENRDPLKFPLSEDRLAALMSVVEKRLAPYGMETVKTQFHGASSSRPGNRPLERKLTDAEARDPVKTAQFVAAIQERAFAPDDYDSRQDFPHGIPWHVGQLAGKGFRPALVCRPFFNIKAGTAALDRAAADLFEMAVKTWGYRYLMFDFTNEDYDSDHDEVTIEQGIRDRFQAVRDRLGPDIFIEACMVWPGPVLGIADGYRPAHDWRGCLEAGLVPTFAVRNHYHGRFFQCDNEFMDPAIHPFTWKPTDKIGTLDRLRLWAGFNAILGYSYLGGAALERVEPRRWWYFQRAMPAQAGRAVPVDLLQDGIPRRWLRACSTPAGGYHLLGLFNWSECEPLDVPVDPGDWDLLADREYLFFDFWAQHVYGPTRTLPSLLAPFSCQMLQVTPTPGEPALVGNTRHVTGQVGIEAWTWDATAKTITAAFRGAPESLESYWIWLPGNEGVAECAGAEVETIRPHLIRLDVHFASSGFQECRLRLDPAILVP